MRYKMSFDKALQECASSPDFLMQLKSGGYLYVESYFCLNQPKYIDWNRTVATMTAYARGHKSECCLPAITEVVREQAREKNEEDAPFFGFVTAPKPKPKPEPKPQTEDIKSRLEQQIALNNKALAETREIFKKLSPNLSETLKTLMKWRHVTVEQLAEASGMSEKTIQRLRKDPPEIEATFESLIQLCIGLHLPPMISDHVLHIAGKSYTDKDAHMAYQLLLASCYDYSIEECDILLKGQGFPPLGNSDKIA